MFYLLSMSIKKTIYTLSLFLTNVVDKPKVFAKKINYSWDNSSISGKTTLLGVSIDCRQFDQKKIAKCL